jgi:hypothetical protein
MAAAGHLTEQYVSNSVEADHDRLKAWLRPMRGLNFFHPGDVSTIEY